MANRFTLAVPTDYLLSRDLCSYGYFLLAPNHWDPRTRVYTTTLDLDGGAVTFRITQGAARAASPSLPSHAAFTPAPGRPGRPLSVTADRELSDIERAGARAALARILRLDEDAGQIAEFHAIDPRFAAEGRGRLMRSASLFEDVIKTVTSCNVTWPSTVAMNAKLCRVFGRRSASGQHAFPSAARLASARPSALRARCSVGYRDARIIELAAIAEAARRGRSSGTGWINGALPDADLFDALTELPGIGPYAAANIMQLMGRYGRLPLDTESIRHGRSVLGFRGTDRQVMKRVHAHFEPMGEHRFRSYWFELWRYYEAKRGPAWTWEQETTGKTFTAALLD